MKQDDKETINEYAERSRKLLKDKSFQRDHLNYPDQNRDHFNQVDNVIEARARNSFLRRLKTIPAFNGGSYNDLRDFFDVVDTLFDSIQNNIEENEFYDQLLLQIRGKAQLNLFSRLATHKKTTSKLFCTFGQ